MKNIHLIKTDKPSRLFYNVGGALLFRNYENHNGVNIYITSDEEIKDVDYRLNIQRDYFKKSDKEGLDYYNKRNDVFKKIILTTDQDLIKDGVQAIDDDFLEWYVENLKCEWVEIKPLLSNNGRALFGYKIIIPKKIPKQETLEEASWRFNPLKKLDGEFLRTAFIKGAKWQEERIGLMEIELRHTKTLLASCEKALEDRDKQERMYSEEDMKEAYVEGVLAKGSCKYGKPFISVEEWFKQFK